MATRSRRDHPKDAHRRRRTAAKHRRTKAPPRAPVDPVRGLGRKDGLGGVLMIAERCGSRLDRVVASLSRAAPGSRRSPQLRPNLGPRSTLGSVAAALAAAGHPVRAAVLDALLTGPATYRSLRKLTNMSAGPLYHHLNQLRLAGLLTPRSRDLYELSRGGRNLAMSLRLLAQVVVDSRRRPGQ